MKSEDLKRAIDTLVNASALPLRREDSSNVSDRYRARATDLQIKSDREALAYITTRMPATYAAVRRAMEITRVVAPDFVPKNILDIGAGPGTVAIAAAHEWAGQDIAFNLIETNQYLERAGKSLFSNLSINALWQNENIINVNSFPLHDMITASYVLNELVLHNHIESVVKKLWYATHSMLLIIEPGTPEGSEIVQQARDILIAQGANIIAPCPQSGTCPLRGQMGQWCHFSVRLARTRDHKALKNAKLGYEDEKFSFIAAAKFPPENRPSKRIIGHVRGSKILNIPVCDETGKHGTLDISKRNPDFKKISKLSWGDGILIN